MDTPERNQTGTPLSKFEESPVFNYINSLSPLKPVKSVNISQTFNSLSFAGIPSVFTSPHIKEFKFLWRHQSPDQFKYGNSADKGNKLGSSDITDALQLSGKHAVQLSESLKFECGSSEGIPMQCSDGVPDAAGPSASLVPSVKEVRGNLLLQDEVLFQEICQTEQKREDLGCDWKSLISNAADLLIFDSPGTETFQEPIQKSSDPDTSFCASPASEFPQDDLSDSHKQCNVPVSSSEQQETGDPSRELKEVDQACNSLTDTCASKCVANHRPNNMDDEAGKCIPFAYEPIINLRGGMRRRCLVYDMAGAHRRNLNNVSDSGSSSLSHFGGNTDKQLVPFKLGIDTPLSGIGLHLNSLAAPSKDHKIVKHEIVATESQLISRLNSIAAFHSPSIDQEPTTNSLNLNCSERDEDPNENSLDVAGDILQASADAAIEDLTQTSPRNKRRKLEQTGEPEGCKRCNCKKSKCLKLYCECFAAGVYCAEPCSCQECFNRPIHEDTVLATRKQVESRNPLAFAPKVIRSSDSIAEIGDEPNKTPASARHKRGCNCKKSSCLKKYCECYQGGVGCSINCRCEGCKNAFGRKDGAQLGTDADPEEEETETGEKSGAGLRLQNTIVPYNKEQNLDSAPPITPFHMGRPSTRLPSSSKRKPPRSTFLAAKYGKPNLP